MHAWREGVATRTTRAQTRRHSWRVKGCARPHRLAQAAVLKSLEMPTARARPLRMDRPPFKVMGECDSGGARPPCADPRQRPTGHLRDDPEADPPPQARLVARHPRGTPQARPSSCLRLIPSLTTWSIGTTACTHGARRGRGRAVWSWMSSFRARRSGIWLVGLRVPTANWRTSQTLVSGGGKGTGKRFWRYCLGPHREPAGGLRLQVHPKLQQ